MAGADDDLDDILNSIDHSVPAAPAPAPAAPEKKAEPATEAPKPPKKAAVEKPSILKVKLAQLSAMVSAFPWRTSLVYQFTGMFAAAFVATSLLAYLHMSSPTHLTPRHIDLFSQIIPIPVKPPPLGMIQKQVAPETVQKEAGHSPSKSKTPPAHGTTPPFYFYKADTSGLDMQDKAKIAIIVLDAGLSKSKLDAVYQLAPSYTTLAFSAYSDVVNPDEAIAKGRKFENWLILPTEVSKGSHDPGPLGLFNSRDPELNRNAFESVLSRNEAFTGFVLRPYAALVQNADQFSTIVSDIFARGYGIVDGSFEAVPPAVLMKGEAASLPYFQADAYVDESLAPDDILGGFKKLELIAQESGSAIGMIRPYPLSLEKLAEWANTLDGRGFVLIPLSALHSGKAPAGGLVPRQDTHGAQTPQSEHDTPAAPHDSGHH